MKKKGTKAKNEPKPAPEFVSFASMQPLFDIHKTEPVKIKKKKCGNKSL